MSEMNNEELKAALHAFVTNGSDEEVTAFYERVKEQMRLAGINIDDIENSSEANNTGEKGGPSEG